MYDGLMIGQYWAIPAADLCRSWLALCWFFIGERRWDQSGQCWGMGQHLPRTRFDLGRFCSLKNVAYEKNIFVYLFALYF